MKNFLLVVNVLALTLPFLAAEVQNQEQPACRENAERLFNQKTVSYVPIRYMLNSYPHYEPNFYQHRPAILINSPYMPHIYYAKPAVLKPHAQIPQWQVLPNIHPPTMARRPRQHPSFFAIPPKKTEGKTAIPTITIAAIPTVTTAAIPTISTTATVESTPIPATEPVVNSVVIPEASSESITTSTPEFAAVPVTPAMA
ncbi:kappa-casein precursor [Daubentonia madagascariensis]|uniref:Kappa-casein n=1 Tax=Daubentonia madagascariensis TaxID=31869 RepID=A0ABD2END1_DAUMA